MNYPEYIYRKFEIVEKDIYGEKHYAAVQIKEYFFGLIKTRCFMKTYPSGFFSDYIGSTWYNRKYIIENAISTAKIDDECNFKYRMTK